MASLGPPTNSLGLDLENLSISDPDILQPAASPAEQISTSAFEPTPPPDSASANPDDPKEDESKPGAPRKKNPYINPERVKTGGAQRDKLTDEELADRMARMREQNEKIKQRRLDVQADEDAFKQTQAAERARQAKTRKVQETVDRTREQNARRKMDKIQSREWDSEKKSEGWSKPQSQRPQAADNAGSPSTPQHASAVPNADMSSSSPARPIAGPLEKFDVASPPPEGQSLANRGQGRGRGASGPSQGQSRGRGRGRGGGKDRSDNAGAGGAAKPSEGAAAPSIQSSEPTS